MEQAKPFSSQVGGHMNILSSADDQFILKPCARTEREFYEQSAQYPSLQSFLAEYMGTLSSSQSQPTITTTKEGEVVVNSVEQVANLTTNQEPEFLCLENLLLPYSKPSILDLKIGTELFDHLATEEKKQRMTLKAQETTSAKLGIRVTGMKVYNDVTKEYEVYGRDYGVGLTEETIYSAITTFFPIDRIDPKLRLALVEEFLDSLQEFLTVLETLPVRMAASSLLFIYEGDLTALQSKFDTYHQFLDRPSSPSSTSSVTSQDLASIPTPPTNLKLIDFAHSYFLNTPVADPTRALPPNTQGPDQGCLLGVRTTLHLLTKLRRELRNSSKSSPSQP